MNYILGVAQGELTREIRILNTVGIAGAIFTSQKGEIIHDVYSDRRFNKEVDQETGYKTKNMICSPVKTVDGKIIGVIQVLNKKKGRFTKDNLLFCRCNCNTSSSINSKCSK